MRSGPASPAGCKAQDESFLCAGKSTKANREGKKKNKSLIQLLHPEVLAHSWDTKLIIDTGSILVIPSSAEQSQQEQARIVLGGHRQPT